MSKKTNTTANTTTTNATTNTTTATMTAADFKQKSYDAYLAYVSFIEGKSTIQQTVEAMSELMSAFGFTLTVDNLANLLTVKMTVFGKDKGEQARKVKFISTFRAFVKGGWKNVQNAPVHSNAGKNPADTKPAKAKQPTKADLLTELTALHASWKRSPKQRRRSRKKQRPRDLDRIHAALSARRSRLFLSINRLTSL